MEVVEHRTQAAAKEAFKQLGQYVDLNQIQVVTMDMWNPITIGFQNAAQTMLSQADIVHDRFHLSQHLNKAMDITRRAENKKLVASQDERLKRTRYLWLKNPVNFTDIQQIQHEQLLKDNSLKTVKAWQL